MDQENKLIAAISPEIIHKQYPQSFVIVETKGIANKYQNSNTIKNYYPYKLIIERVTYKKIYAHVNDSNSSAVYEREQLVITLGD